MAEEKAYIGYRSAGRRPEGRQDRRAAADAPLSALRGAVSGVLGAPGDIESLIRMLPGLSERTVLPTSEDVEKRLPLPELNRTPTGRAFTTAGQLGGGFYGGPGSPLRAIAALPSAVSRAGRDFLMSTSPVNVIKPKGGNWLAGSVERAVEPMRAKVMGYEPSVRLQTIDKELEQAAKAGLDPETMQTFMSQIGRERARLEPDAAMNRWLEQKLSKYIKNEMATPEDPLRALADRGVTHIPEGVESLERVTEWIPQTLESRRTAAGFPAGGMSQTPYGQGWEQLADEAVHNMPARMRVSPDTGGGSTKALQVEQENPWLLKVPPETMTYGAYPVEVRQELGFEHLVDELRNAINPESGLPANLRWKYADLDKVTVPQAVQRVADINEWRAAQKAEADLARARNPATFTHKEYPEQGMSWVELRQPEGVPEGFKEVPGTGGERFTGPNGNMYSKEQVARLGPLEDALKYEGETMGHCVGGYCPDVLEGRSRIYSLRDKKGQPHVTIEVEPIRGSELGRMMGDLSDEEAALMYKNPPQRIVQIKGKGNKAPKAEYLPAVQDFVRSGQWSDVGDLENTGLRSARDVFNDTELKVLKSKGHEVGNYLSPEEIESLQKTFSPGASAAPGAEGFASGGLVEYNPAKIQGLVDSLREEMYG